MFRLTTTMLRATAVAIPVLLASAIAVPTLLVTSIAAPANAQFSVSIGYDNFHDRLAPYGNWSNHRRWGEVWRPYDVGRDFRPYYDGYWVETHEYGWLWVSNESWGDIPYHYGRWVFEPRDGWLWVPGYVWGPSWVVWRSGGGNIGWFPMPPGDDYYGNGPYRDNFDNHYGYSDWYGPSFGNDQFLSLWIFVGDNHFRDRNFRNYTVPYRDYNTFISQTTNTTNYITINNYVVNRSVDRDRLQRATNERFRPVSAESVIGRNAMVTQSTIGRQVERRERQRRPMPASINRDENTELNSGNRNSNVQQPDAETPNARQPDADRTPQDRGAQGGNRDAPAANVPQARRNAVPQGETEDADREDERPEARTNPRINRGVRETTQGERENAQAERGRQPLQAPRTRAAPEQGSDVAAQGGRAARDRGDAPAADVVDQENAGDNQARADRRRPAEATGQSQADADQQAADDRQAAEDQQASEDRRRAAARRRN
jgi:hypothetical protein